MKDVDPECLDSWRNDQDLVEVASACMFVNHGPGRVLCFMCTLISGVDVSATTKTLAIIGDGGTLSSGGVKLF